MSPTLEKVRRLGGSTADAILDPSTLIFTQPEIDGLVGYRVQDNLAVVFGDPVCAPQDIPKLARKFDETMKEKGLTTITVNATRRYRDWAISHLYPGAIEFGEELIFDPADNPQARTGTHASLVRRKVRHAQKEGVEVHEYLGNDPKLEIEMQNVALEWERGRKGPQLHISSIDLFSERAGRRWFYAVNRGKVIGVVILSHLIAKKGWLMNHLMIHPVASHGTPEILVTTALEVAEREGSHYITVGAVPYPSLKSIIGFSPMFTFLARMGFRFYKSFFHLGGRKKFWEKFHPVSEPLYLLFSTPSFNFKEVKSLLKTMQDP